MTYVPHTEQDRQLMLAAIGALSSEALFDAVPVEYRFPDVQLSAPLSEPEVLAELRTMAARNVDVTSRPCFLGAGAYNHFAQRVGHLTSRPSSTRPIPPTSRDQRGTLQAIFEYQTMICRLTGMK